MSKRQPVRQISPAQLSREESRLAAIIDAGVVLPLAQVIEIQSAIQAGGEPLEQIRAEVRDGSARTFFWECWHRDAIARKDRRLRGGPIGQTIKDLTKRLLTPPYAFRAADDLIAEVEDMNRMPIEALYLLLADPTLRHEYPPRPWLLGHYLTMQAAVGSGSIRWSDYNQMPPGFIRLHVPSVPLPWDVA